MTALFIYMTQKNIFVYSAYLFCSTVLIDVVKNRFYIKPLYMKGDKYFTLYFQIN